MDAVVQRAPTGRARLIADNAPAGRLFAPLGAQALQLSENVEPERVVPLADGTFRHHTGRSIVNGPLCDVTYGSEDTLSGEQRALPERARLLQIDRNDPDEVPPAILPLIDEAHRGLTIGAPTPTIVERCRALLASRFQYLLPGQQGAAEDLREFVSGSGGGHCELFATALAVMLRLQGIPCRLVSGYQVHEWDASRGEFVVRGRDAHAWVEWWDADRGRFITADPTPPGTDANQTSGRSWLRSITAAASELWMRLTRFDADDRKALLAWCLALPGRLVAAIGAHPLGSLALALLCALALWLRRARRALRPVAIADYERALKRAGLALRPGETPRELLDRAADAIGSEHLEALARATEAHEQSRFA